MTRVKEYDKKAIKDGQGKQKHANLVSGNRRRVVAPCDDGKENPWTRELVLPTDSNLVKGNV